MKCEKCGLEMFARPVFLNGNRISNFECKNKQCERYVADSNQATQITIEDAQDNVQED